MSVVWYDGVGDADDLEEDQTLNKFLVIDVESIGLHGEGFAVSWVRVVSGEQISNGLYACLPNDAAGDADDREWVMKNVKLDFVNCPNPYIVRQMFWNVWTEAKEQGFVLAADCAWPVEAQFLAQCVADNPTRKWDGPYPLIDIGSVMLGAGMDPMAKYPRVCDAELPEHNPRADAMQSARLLIASLGCAEALITG